MICDTCVRRDRCISGPKPGEIIVSCGAYKKPPTNADRIRAMSDEELAEFIGGIYTLERDAWGDYDPCVVVDQGVKIRDKEDMLDWLRSPTGGEK